MVTPAKNLRLLAFDFGTRSIGVASANSKAISLGSGCNELTPLRAKEGIPDWNELKNLLEQWQPNTVIVGLPLDAEGNDMEITRRARKFGNRLRSRFQCKVEFIDERLSTKAAKHEANERGLGYNYRKKPVDSIAARLILESWMREFL